MTRYTITLSDNVEGLLNEISKTEGVTKAEAMRRSVAIYTYIMRELSMGDKRLIITDLDDNVEKEIVLTYSILSTRKTRRSKQRKVEQPDRFSKRIQQEPQDSTFEPFVMEGV